MATTRVPGLDLVGPLERAQSDVTVLRRVDDAAELLAVARSGTVDALLLAGDLTPLTRALLAELDDLVRPVGLVAVSEVGEDRARARRLGVRTHRADVDPLELAGALLAAARDAQTGRPHQTAADEDAAVDVEPLPRGLIEGPPAAEPADAPGGPPDDAAPSPVDRRATPDGGPPREPAPEDSEGAPDQDGAEGSGAALAEATGPGPERSVPATASTGPLRGDARCGDTGPSGHGTGAEDEAEPTSTETGEAVAPAVTRPGRITAVWGPAGAPGRTTVAVNLAAETAAQGARVLLVDADTYAPSAGVLLGLTDESAGLARAARAADRGRLDRDALAQAAVTVRAAGADLSVLTGLTRPERWPEVRGAALEEVLRQARRDFDEVVVDVGFCLEEDEELSFDVPAPQRNGATLAALRTADRVFALGAGDAVGLPRLMRGVEALREAVPDGPEPVVVVNRVRSAASGTAPQSQIAAVWSRFGTGRPPAVFLPSDPGACDRAVLGGQLLAEAAPKSPLRRAVASLAALPDAPEEGAAGRTTDAGAPSAGERPSLLRRLGAAVAATLRPGTRPAPARTSSGADEGAGAAGGEPADRRRGRDHAGPRGRRRD
ncbi:AAA family ATPase [Micrococcus luteus]